MGPKPVNNNNEAEVVSTDLIGVANAGLKNAGLPFYIRVGTTGYERGEDGKFYQIPYEPTSAVFHLVEQPNEFLEDYETRVSAVLWNDFLNRVLDEIGRNSMVRAGLDNLFVKVRDAKR